MKAADKNIGKVLKVTRKTYDVALGGKIIPCTLRGKLASEGAEFDAVKVGDNVKISLISEHEGVIEEILPRKSQLSRTIESRAYQEHIIAVNINQILIILAAKDPKFKSGLLDRYLVIAEKNRLRPVICINKIDLSAAEKFNEYQKYYAKLDYPVFFTSALTGEGLSELAKIFKNSVTALVGQSGVGKSTLIKAIEPGLDIKVADISPRTNKGQHTTTAVQLFPLSNGGYAIDTPGIRELGFWEILKGDLARYFIEIPRYAPKCQFSDCTHIHEPGCAVIAAVENGEMFGERYWNYVNIYDSLKSAHYE